MNRKTSDGVIIWLGGCQTPHNLVELTVIFVIAGDAPSDYLTSPLCFLAAPGCERLFHSIIIC